METRGTIVHLGKQRISRKYSVSEYLAVTYRYRADKETYENDLYSLFPHSVNRSMSRLVHYQFQKQIPVYYDP